VNFDLTDEQQVVADLAAQVFDGQTSIERIKQAERDQDFDRRLWAELAGTNLLGLCLPESVGGSGMGVVALALLCQAQGATVAPIPLLPTVAAAMSLADAVAGDGADPSARHHFGEVLAAAVAGTAVLTVALNQGGANDVLSPTVAATPTGNGYHVRGWLPTVPYLAQADHVVVPAMVGDEVAMFLVDVNDTGVDAEAVRTTDLQPAAHLRLDLTIAANRRFGDADALARLRDVWLVGQASTVVGVAESAVRQTAQYLVSREQFGRSLASFQAVGQRAADAYITTEAIRVTTLNAAWRIDEGLDASEDVSIAAFWAADGGQSVTLACQHLHGGIGADVDYPIHRFFLWAARLANTAGTASSHLARLGTSIAIRHGRPSQPQECAP